MRVLFMGTPDFASASLSALINDKSNKVIAVVSQPDKPKGRGHKMQPTPVKETALKHGIPVFQPETLRNNAFAAELNELNPDVIVVVAYGQILPEYVLNYPQYGCINVHGSLLPKYRGAAPVQRCVIAGEKKTGVTTMYMDKTLDTGDIILKSETDIGEYETAGELFDRLAEMGGKLLAETLSRIADGTAPREKQDDSQACYAHMLDKETGHIDWTKPADEIIHLILGTNPWPAAYTSYKSETMKIYMARHGEAVSKAKPGEIVGINKKNIAVACGDGNSVLIDEIQFKGGKRMTVSSYLNGHSVELGEILV